MGRRFVKKAIRKIKRALDPEIIRKEYVDTFGNRHILDINFRPHLPTTEGDMKLKYKSNKGEN